MKHINHISPVVMAKRKEVVSETTRNQLKDGLFLSGVSGRETAKRKPN